MISSIALDRDANEGRRPNLKLPTDDTALAPASVLLQRLHDEAPADHFTLGWLMSRMHKRSFGLIMLLLGVVAVAPGVSIVAGLLLMIPAFQMILGHNMPVFPRRVAARPLPTRHLAALVQRAVPVLRSLEKLIHPRWPTPFDATKRLVGAVVVLLNITLLFTPVPLSNVVPALVIALISLAYLEEDGLLLSIALLASVVVLAVELAVVWETILGAKWIFALWH
ncbi:exopolysaccharide biosynthesis protein [Bradyrhizobium barranii]|uniref:Exopolysaccharide biosynthesis protein n=1 Tax=Bradyrhizobium barranii subsp. barranii TaxID=2823807 RepID=A0A939M322_9BRAD|nr:exopolysaccharide biosynthesis protein [Bradyrhizobium barranii]UEM14940.1 exopolysaccharide biosynthesis protein [Bradyrhizobium barranii subsp. barranii]